MLITSLKLEERSSPRPSPSAANPALRTTSKPLLRTYIINWMALLRRLTFAMLSHLAVDAPIAYAFAYKSIRSRTTSSGWSWVHDGSLSGPYRPLVSAFNSSSGQYTAAAYLPRIALPIGDFHLKSFIEGIPPTWRQPPFIDGAESGEDFFFKDHHPLGSVGHGNR